MGTFPEVLCKLPNLHSLDFGQNEITELPDFLRSSIGEMTDLEQLDLSNNHLKWLPDNFRNLRNLEILHIEGNLFTELPGSIGELVNLRKLYVDKTIKIPHEVFQLSKLEIL